ncbi:MAG: hypothetical protein ABI811_03275 [Acidobacteriota bacterium]
MSRDIRQYWKEVRALENRLPEFIFLVATDGDVPGFVTEAAAGVAARLLYAKTHRAATEEEISAHQLGAEQAVRDAKKERMRLSGAAMVVVDPATSEPSPRRRR